MSIARRPADSRPAPGPQHVGAAHAGRGRGFHRGWRPGARSTPSTSSTGFALAIALVVAARHADRDRPRAGRDARRAPDPRGDDVPLDAHRRDRALAGPRPARPRRRAPLPPDRRDGFLRRVFAPRIVWERAKDPAVWRDLVYLLLVFFPLAIATFCIAVIVWARRRSASPPSRSRTGRAPGSSSARASDRHAAGGARLPRRRHRRARAAPVVPRASSRRRTGGRCASLLGPAPSERVEQLTRQRTEAVDAAVAERRRIERDLHDGAQQRLTALAIDLGRARAKLDSDPAAARDARRAGARGREARARRAPQPRARHPPGDPHRPRPRRGALGARRAEPRSGRDLGRHRRAAAGRDRVDGVLRRGGGARRTPPSTPPRRRLRVRVWRHGRRSRRRGRRRRRRRRARSSRAAGSRG